MRVRVLGDRFGPSGGRDSLADCFAVEVKRQLVEQVFRLPISRQVHAVAKQLGLAIVGQIIGHEERTAGDGLEDAHVDVIADAAVECDAGG